MKIRKNCVLAASALVLAWTGQAQAASVINNGYEVANTVNGTLTNSTAFSFQPVNLIADESVSLISSTIVGDFGAAARASIGAVASVSFAASLQNSVATSVTSRGTVRGFSGLDNSGRSLSFLSNNSGFSTLKSTFGEGDVQANLDTQLFAGARLRLTGCFVGCVSTNAVDFGIGNPDPIRVLGYDSTTNSVAFLGETQTGALPRRYDGGFASPISAELNALDLSGSTGSGFALTYHSEQRLAGAFVDVAQVLADTFDVPQAALQGSVLGFDYTTVSAKIGIALNAVYDATVRPAEAMTTYIFSANMEMFDRVTETWSLIGKTETLANNFTAILRPFDPNIQSVSVLPLADQVININSNLALKVALEDHVRLLEVHGNGLDAGPLFSHDGQIVLASVGSFSSSTSVLSRTALQSFTLDFAGSSGDPVQDPGSVAGDFIFIPRGNNGIPNVESGGMFLVTNNNTEACNGTNYAGCIIDPSFQPIMVERFLRFDTLANLSSYVYSTSFENYGAIFNAQEGTYGQQGTTEQLLTALQNLPSAGQSYQLQPQIAFNANPWVATPNGAVPEPGTWIMMIFGFGLIGSTMRRRNRPSLKVSCA